MEKNYKRKREHSEDENNVKLKQSYNIETRLKNIMFQKHQNLLIAKLKTLLEIYEIKDKEFRKTIFEQYKTKT